MCRMEKGHGGGEREREKSIRVQATRATLSVENFNAIIKPIKIRFAFYYHRTPEILEKC